ncbi:MAG: hypothetical protein OHK0023_22910 [Anaerolineae bacterium]
MRWILRHIDKSLVLARLLAWFRRYLPARRGLLTLFAVVLAIVSLVVHILFLASGQNVWLGLCGFLLLHVAMIMGFLGILLAEALGKGYRE